MSHGVNNDIWQFYCELSLKGQMLLWLAVFNIPVGPWATDARWQQCRSALQDIYQKHDWRDVPLFEAMAHSMLSDPKYADVAGEEDAYGCLWERLAEDSPWRRKGVKLVRSRFMAFSRKARDEMRQASSRGFLGARPAGGHQLEGPRDPRRGQRCDPPLTTSSSRESVEEKALRLSCANNLVLGCMAFNDADACMYLRLTLEFSSWSSRSNVGMGLRTHFCVARRPRRSG